MAEYKYDQFSFAVGQIDPKMQSRPDWDGYYTAAKVVQNAQTLPQGGVQRRWGLKYVDTCTVVDADEPFEAEISTLLFDNDLVYLLLWEAQSLKIYLENKLIATVTSGNNYNGEDIVNLRFTQVQDRLIITNTYFAPYQLIRTNNAPNAITAIDSTNMYLIITTPLTAGNVYPVQFTTSGSLPTTDPQIYVGRTYFVNAITTNNVRIYSSSSDAINNVNFYTITALGANSNLIVQNTWTLSAITFINVPGYDFDGGYSAITFTPSATTGNSVTVTLSAPLANLDSRFVGGFFTGNGGILRITSVADTTDFTGYTVASFASTSAIEGTLVFLGEPAWSTARGYPSLASFFQNRLVFANSVSLINGIWLSVVNEVYNFDDSETLADNAISWYPGGGQVNYIVALTSARALIIHTNNGAFSTPLLIEQPVTPTNFTLTEQNKFACDNIQPVFIDNQIIFVDTASNVINMIWDIAQSSYTTNNISVMSSSLINSPVDMTSFYEPKATDGFYALFVNVDGTLAVYQTLYEQHVGAWSQMVTSSQIVTDQVNDYTTMQSNFIHVISGNNRCWVLVQRQMPIAGTPVAISGFTSTTLTATTHGIPVGTTSLVTFTTSGTLPASTPALNTTQYWWAYAVDANTINVYTDTAKTTQVTFTSSGSNSNVVPWPLTPQIFIEEINFNVYTDAANQQVLGSPSATVSGLSYLNGNVVNVKGDGYLLLNQTVVGGAINSGRASTTYEIGLNFITTLQPLPISLPQQFGLLYNPLHIRAIYIRYYQTIGAQFEGYNILTKTMQQIVVGVPPVPQDGVFTYTPMEGWNNQTANIIVTQPNPLPMTILGFSYVLEA